MYTNKMYCEDRKFLLDRLSNIRDRRNELINEWGFDDLFPSDMANLNHQIKFYQSVLLNARNRYYS